MRAPLGGKARGSPLQRHPHLERAQVAGEIGRLEEVDAGRGWRPQQDGAGTAPGRHQAIGLKPHQRLAHDRPRDAEGAADGVLGGQLVAGRHGPRHDLLEQLPVEDVREPALGRRGELNVPSGSR